MTVEKLKSAKLDYSHCQDCERLLENKELVKIMTRCKHTSFVLCRECIIKLYEMGIGTLGGWK